MSFDGQYLTYLEYQSLGGTLEETPFNLLEYEVRRKIDVKTFNRIKNSDMIPQEVKLCEYNLINSIQAHFIETTQDIGNIKSESIDGYSVNYMTTGELQEIIKSKEVEIDDIIMTYLTGVIVDGEHVIYCGM